MLRNIFVRFILIIIATSLLIFVEYKFEVVDYLRFPNAVKTFEVNSASDSIAYSPDGKMFAIAGGKRTRAKIRANRYTQGYSQVEVRRTIDGSIVRSWDFFSAQSLAFSPDSLTLAAGTYGGKVSVWQIENGKLLHSFERISQYYANTKLLIFTPDGNNLLGFTLKPFKSKNSPDNVISIWNLENKTNRLLSGEFICAALSPDGKILALGSRNQTIDLYHLNNLALIKRLEVGQKPRFVLEFSPDGQKIAFIGYSLKSLPGSISDRQVYLHNIEDGSLLNVFYHATILPKSKESLENFAISPDGRYLAVSYSRSAVSDFFIGAPRWSDARYYGRIRVWRIEDGKQLQILRGHKHRTDNVVFMPNSQLLTSTGADGKVRFWKVPSRNYSWFLMLGGLSLTALVYSRRSELISLLNR